MSARPQKRFYDEARKRPFLVARACGYIRKEDCSMCKDEMVDGEVYAPACRLLAEELVAVIVEGLEIPCEIVRQDT